MVTIIDPHISVEPSYHISQDAERLNLFVKDSNGDADFKGWCWPGDSRWIDFLNPKARQFWAEQFQLDKYKGSTLTLFTWNDMNEPSVFTGPEITMPKSNIHFGGIEHREIHNVYGMYQVIQRITLKLAPCNC
jgi:alpha 1,3-glucosidase